MPTTKASLTQILAKGILGGALAGCLVGAYVLILSGDFVI